jgi:hypothetical protein
MSMHPINSGPSAWSSPCMFDRVPRWPADSFRGGNSRQREAVSMFNPRGSDVPLPPG